MTTEYIDAVVIDDEPGVRSTDAVEDLAYTEACPECDRTFTAKTELAAKGALGRHRKKEHGPGGPGSSGPKGRPPVREDQAVPIQVLKTAANEIPDKRSAPSVADLNKAFGRGFYTLSTLAASYAAETDPTVTTEADRDAVADYLSLSPEAANEVAYPFAKAFGKSRLNKKYGRGIVDNIDLVSAGAELVNLGIRWRRYMTERNRRVDLLHQPQAPVPGSPPTNGHVAGTNGNAPPVPVYYPAPGTGEPATGFTGPRPMQGHVVSAEEVRRRAATQ